MSRELKPVKNVHRVNPRVCATCRHGEIEDGGFFCHREDGFYTDAGDMWHWFHVCDGYAPALYLKDTATKA